MAKVNRVENVKSLAEYTWDYFVDFGLISYRRNFMPRKRYFESQGIDFSPVSGDSDLVKMVTSTTDGLRQYCEICDKNATKVEMHKHHVFGLICGQPLVFILSSIILRSTRILERNRYVGGSRMILNCLVSFMTISPIQNLISAYDESTVTKMVLRDVKNLSEDESLKILVPGLMTTAFVSMNKKSNFDFLVSELSTGYKNKDSNNSAIQSLKQMSRSLLSFIGYQNPPAAIADFFSKLAYVSDIWIRKDNEYLQANVKTTRPHDQSKNTYKLCIHDKI
jgi:hypothetical protein